jgi:hypothetical protein
MVIALSFPDEGPLLFDYGRVLKRGDLDDTDTVAFHALMDWHQYQVNILVRDMRHAESEAWEQSCKRRLMFHAKVVTFLHGYIQLHHGGNNV